MIPADLDIWRFTAIALIFAMWAGYGPILNTFGHGTLNSQLHGVRLKWMRMLLNSKRESRVFDGILLGHISSQVSFFGSATLIVLAGLVGTLQAFTGFMRLWPRRRCFRACRWSFSPCTLQHLR